MQYFEKNRKIRQTVSGKAFYSFLRLGTADPSGVARGVSRGTRYEAQVLETQVMEAQVLEAHQPTFSAI